MVYSGNTAAAVLAALSFSAIAVEGRLGQSYKWGAQPVEHEAVRAVRINLVRTPDHEHMAILQQGAARRLSGKCDLDSLANSCQGPVAACVAASASHASSPDWSSRR